MKGHVSELVTDFCLRFPLAANCWIIWEETGQTPWWSPWIIAIITNFNWALVEPSRTDGGSATE